VLVVDLDPQGNATMGSGIDKRKLVHTVYDVLLGHAASGRDPPAQPARAATTCWAPTASWPAPRWSWWTWSAANAAEGRCSRVPATTTSCSIDCPPSLSLLTLNGLCARTA
jgi:chromosome partitioning protein